MLLLNTGELLEINTSTTNSTHIVVSYADITSSAISLGATGLLSSTAATQTICYAPSASTGRQIKHLSVHNDGSTSQTVRIQKDISGTDLHITPNVALQPQEMLIFSNGEGWSVVDGSGREKVTASTNTGVDGRTVGFLKVGGATEAAGVMYNWAKDAGMPGAWTPGTGALSGRVLNGTTEAGAIIYQNAVGGTNYLTGFNASASVATQAWLVDVVWANTGIVPTTLTAQTINSVTFPARDIDGSTDGHGYELALYAHTATTNAGAVTTITVGYYDSDNQPSTGTIPSFPATAVAGTVVPVLLAAGDDGVRSVSNITLGTTLGAGYISLLAFRRLANASIPVANVGSYASFDPNPGIRLYDGTCMQLWQLPTATTATTVQGTLQIATR
jgi:hypothetical protein